MLKSQWLPLACGFGLFKLTRMLKKATGPDVLYFVLPYLYVNYGVFCIEQKNVFESGYPAHPYILEQRMNVINRACYSFPPILKNEIEYIHTKLSEEHARLAQLQESNDEVSLKFERVFTIGQVTSDYKRMIKEHAKEPVASKEEEAKKLLKFRVIVEDGELYLQCIDPFEEIFQISRSSIENLELMELLDPFLFENHRDIINALFEVYHGLCQDYLRVFYEEKIAAKRSSSLADRAVAKLKQKYNLSDEGDGAPNNNARKTILDAT